MTLTQKQQRQVAAAAPAQKNKLRAMYNQQNAQRAQPSAQLSGTTRGRQQPQAARTRRVPVTPALNFAFDGFDKRHMPLDELTAPYTTTNFVNTMEFATSTSMDQVIVVCPRMRNPQETYSGPLTDYIAMRYDAAELIDGSIPVIASVRAPIIDVPTRGAAEIQSSVRARLHNLSIKLECLGTNTGLYPPGSVYLGTVPCIETGSGSTGAEESLTIKQAWANDSIQVGYLRSIPAASLVEKPVQLDAAIAENVSYKSWRDMTVPSVSVNEGALAFSTALEPIVLYVPRCGEGTTAVQYRLVIGQQWCSRHPHNIMLRSTQKQHHATTPDLWHKAVAAVKDVGPKIMQRAADGALDALAANFKRLMNPQRAIADAAQADVMVVD